MRKTRIDEEDETEVTSEDMGKGGNFKYNYDVYYNGD